MNQSSQQQMQSMMTQNATAQMGDMSLQEGGAAMPTGGMMQNPQASMGQFNAPPMGNYGMPQMMQPNQDQLYQQMQFAMQGPPMMGGGGGGMGRGGGGGYQPRGGNDQQNNQILEKYKTAKCRHFEQHGNCDHGQLCRFAHGDEELRQPYDQMNETQLALALKSASAQQSNYNSYGGNRGGYSDYRGRGRGGGGDFRGGYSDYRGRGRGGGGDFRGGGGFVHRGGMRGRGGYEDRGGRGGGYGDRGGRGGFQSRGGGGAPGGGPGQYFKTKKCNYFEQHGWCKYEEKCTYAHGDEDLRQPDDSAGGQQNIMPPPMYSDNQQQQE